MNIMFYRYEKLTRWVSRYGVYRTLLFVSGRVANRRNRQAITRQRLLRRLKRLLLVFYLWSSMASFSSRLARHKIQRTLQTVQLRILGLSI